MSYANTIVHALRGTDALPSRATGSIKINLTEVLELGDLWGSQPLVKFSHSLSEGSSNVNAGNLVGNRMFYANDYMVRHLLFSAFVKPSYRSDWC